MVLIHSDITDNVEVLFSVLARSKVPRLVLWIIFVCLQSLKLIFKVNNIVCLFISQSSIFILSECFFHHILLSHP